MAFKLIRHVGLINATTLGDDAAHSIDCGKLSAGAAYRVSSLNANDVCIKLSMEGTAATATNGITMNKQIGVMIRRRERTNPKRLEKEIKTLHKKISKNDIK